jgi:hypothetical protein
VSPLPITLAAGPYDRTRALADGRVTVAGADLRYITLDPEEIFFRMVTHGEFDVSEMSMATYHVLKDQAEQRGAAAPFAAIPVFPSRMFRHTSGTSSRTPRPPRTCSPRNSAKTSSSDTPAEETLRTVHENQSLSFERSVVTPSAPVPWHPRGREGRFSPR